MFVACESGCFHSSDFGFPCFS
uniref:Uncharacterized protein n=1 Tax=Arundo donax TaxID=35708 RepID=A0A0A9C1K8_ARUDO